VGSRDEIPTGGLEDGVPQKLEHFCECKSINRGAEACYEGRSINKLQNGVILLVFKTIKILNS